MSRTIPFGTFTRQLNVHLDRLSYSELVPPVRYDAQGNALPQQPVVWRVSYDAAIRLLRPYFSLRLNEQLRAVLPLSMYLAAFQLLILRQTIADAWIITAGLTAVILGLMLFMEGLKVGLMPFGEAMGMSLPARAGLPVLLLVTLTLGVGVTFAEPAIGALQTVGSAVSVKQAPYLYLLLNEWATVLVLGVGLGVGMAAVLGTLRFLYDWRLKSLIYAVVLPLLGVTIYVQSSPELAKILGLAYDCGAVTTGPVTVPLVLALGIGIARSTGTGGGGSLSGFGIVTLASLFPILVVMGLAIYIDMTMTPAMIEQLAAERAGQGVGEPAWYQVTPGVEIIGGVRAIVPLVLFLFLVMWLILRQKIDNLRVISFGIFLCVLGMVLFNLGLSYGLSKLGTQSGSVIPAAFINLPEIPGSPLYLVNLGIAIAIGFAWLLGFGATLAEPALNALGITVENMTNGSFRKRTLMNAVSCGVGFGIALGIVMFIFALPLASLLIPGYAVALVLTWFSDEKFVNIAWDSAGVTTGPVTVPLVLAMGLAFAGSLDAVAGFGILAMASIGPIIAVLSTGLFIRFKINRRYRRELARARASQLSS